MSYRYLSTLNWMSIPHSVKPQYYWIAAHKDVKGNERADKEAKKAALGAATPAECLSHELRSPLPSSIGVMKHQFLLKLEEEWANSCSRSPRRVRIEKVAEEFSFEKHQKLLDNLTQIQSSLLFQIQSNHLPLNSYLHRIEKAHSRDASNAGAGMGWRPQNQLPTSSLSVLPLNMKDMTWTKT